MIECRGTISSFSGKFGFLSNFYRFPFTYDGLLWPTAEHAYQAAKFRPGAWTKLIREADSPARAKRMGKMYPIHTPDWANARIEVMRKILWAKFSHPDMSWRLLETEGILLVEGNSWGDRYWGMSGDPLQGENHLGKLLMETRNRLWEELP